MQLEVAEKSARKEGVRQKKGAPKNQHSAPLGSFLTPKPWYIIKLPKTRKGRAQRL